MTTLLHPPATQRDPVCGAAAGTRCRLGRRLRPRREQDENDHGLRRQEDRHAAPQDPWQVQARPDARHLEPERAARAGRVSRVRPGQPGAPAVSVWANVTNAGSVLAGQGISVQHVSAGTYQVTITAPACAHGANAPVISVSDTNPPGGQAAGAFPVAWFGATGSTSSSWCSPAWSWAGRSRRPTTPSTVMDTCM